MTSARLKFILGGAAIIGALAWLGFVGFQESKAYYVTVTEYAAMKDGLEGETLKVAGDVVAGSIDRSISPMEFTISHEGSTLKVQYVGQAVIPDTFKDGSKAVVEGTVDDQGVFRARHIEAKCASKYEAEYEKRGT
jgi:cytochrome c-type biogenesis protein CcmE